MSTNSTPLDGTWQATDGRLRLNLGSIEIYSAIRLKKASKSKARIDAFFDSNGNGAIDSGEQRLARLSISKKFLDLVDDGAGSFAIDSANGKFTLSKNGGKRIIAKGQSNFELLSSILTEATSLPSDQAPESGTIEPDSSEPPKDKIKDTPEDTNKQPSSPGEVKEPSNDQPKPEAVSYSIEKAWGDSALKEGESAVFKITRDKITEAGSVRFLTKELDSPFGRGASVWGQGQWESAKSNHDYEAFDGIIQFAAGEKTKEISVQIKRDGVEDYGDFLIKGSPTQVIENWEKFEGAIEATNEFDKILVGNAEVWIHGQQMDWISF